MENENVMSEQIFLNERCKFYARESKGEKPQMVYLNATVNGERFVISTNVKVKPNQFDVKHQKAIVSNIQNELDNLNNKIVNDVINTYTRKFKEFIMFLNQNPEQINSIKENIFNFVPMKKKNSNGSNSGNGKKFTETLEYIFGKELEQEVKEGRISEHFFSSKQSYLKVFFEFIKVKSIPNEWSSLTTKTYKQYSDFLVNERKNRGKALNVSTINNNLSALKAVVNAICNRNDDMPQVDTSRWQAVKTQITTSEKKSVNHVFTDEQLQKIIDLDLDGTAAIIRDIFVFGCFVGQRPADNVRLLKGEGKRFNSKGIEVISLLPHKTRKTDKIAIVPIFNVALVDSIINKFHTNSDYKEYLNKTDTQRNTLNRQYIKQIFALAGLTDTYEVTKQIGNEIVTETKTQANSAHAYLSRHYFITYMCKNGISENDVIEMTGHTSTKQIHETYSHLTTEQQAEKLTGNKIVRKLAGLETETEQQNQTADNDLKMMVAEVLKKMNCQTDTDYLDKFLKDKRITPPQKLQLINSIKGDNKSIDEQKVAQIALSIVELREGLKHLDDDDDDDENYSFDDWD